MQLYILALLGLMLHYGALLNSALKKPEFTWNTFISQNLFMFILSLVFSGIVVYLKDDVSEFFVVTKLSAVFVGYFAGDIYYRLTKIFGDRLLK